MTLSKKDSEYRQNSKTEDIKSNEITDKAQDKAEFTSLQSTNCGDDILTSSLQSLRNTKEIKEQKSIESNDLFEGSVIILSDSSPKVCLRRNDETVTDTCQNKRKSARLSLHNDLEIVPEEKPLETKHKENKDEEFTALIENMKKCNDLESLKLACLLSFS